MSELQLFQQVVGQLPKLSDADMESREDTKSSEGEGKYWETNAWFLSAITPMLRLTPSDVVYDLGCGQGLLCLQIAHLNIAQRVYGIDKVKGRVDLADENRDTFVHLLSAQHRNSSPVEFETCDFTDADFVTTLKDATVLTAVFDMADPGKKNSKETTDLSRKLGDTLQDILKKSQAGTRVLSNNLITNFRHIGEGREHVQVIRITLDQPAADEMEYKINRRLSPVKKIIPKKNEPQKVPAYVYKSAEDRIPKQKTAFDFTPSPNTSKKESFLPFYLYTVKSFTGVEKRVKSAEDAHEDVWSGKAALGFIPIQVSPWRWESFPFKVSGTNGNSNSIVTLVVLPEATRLKYEISVPNTELFSLEAACKTVVARRNSELSQGPRLISPTGAPGTIENFIPSNLLQVLRISNDDVKRIGPDGIEERNLIFHVHNDADVDNYVQKRNPLLKIPVIFTGRATENLGVKIPEEEITNLVFTKDRVRVMQRTSPANEFLGNFSLSEPSRLRAGVTANTLSIESQKFFPVIATDETEYQHASNSWTVEQMEKHSRLPLADRKNPMCMPCIPILRDEGFNLQPPYIVRLSDLSAATGLEKCTIHKYTGVAEQGSLQRFHCHEDGSLVWTIVSGGQKLCFFLLNPTTRDYKYMATCAEKRYSKEFLPTFMKGRVVWEVLSAGQSVLYNGGIPHAFYAIKDTLFYGGRYLTTHFIPDLVKFGETQVRADCRGHGYTYDHVKKALWAARSKVFENLWEMRCNSPDLFLKDGGETWKSFTQMITKHRVELGITETQLKITQSWFMLLAYSFGTAYHQTVSGVFHEECDDLMVRTMMANYQKHGVFTPTLVNMGPVSSIVDRAKEGDYDFPDQAFMRTHKITPYDVEEFYSCMFCETTSCVLKKVDKSWGIRCTSDIKLGEIVSTYTGYLRTSAEMENLYWSGLGFGKARPLKKHVLDATTKETTILWVDANIYGGMSYFINESATPNCQLVPWCVGGKAVLMISAVQHIPPGEELTIPLLPQNHGLAHSAVSPPQQYLEFLEAKSAAEAAEAEKNAESEVSPSNPISREVDAEPNSVVSETDAEFTEVSTEAEDGEIVNVPESSNIEVDVSELMDDMQERISEVESEEDTSTQQQVEQLELESGVAGTSLQTSPEPLITSTPQASPDPIPPPASDSARDEPVESPAKIPSTAKVTEPVTIQAPSGRTLRSQKKSAATASAPSTISSKRPSRASIPRRNTDVSEPAVASLVSSPFQTRNKSSSDSDSDVPSPIKKPLKPTKKPSTTATKSSTDSDDYVPSPRKRVTKLSKKPSKNVIQKKVQEAVPRAGQRVTRASARSVPAARHPSESADQPRTPSPQSRIRSQSTQTPTKRDEKTKRREKVVVDEQRAGPSRVVHRRKRDDDEAVVGHSANKPKRGREETSSSSPHSPLLSRAGKALDFEFRGRRVRKYWGYTVPNEQSKAAYEGISKRRQEKAKEIEVGRYYATLEDFEAMNDILLKLYKKEDGEYRCGVCAHLGIPITRKRDKPFDPFTLYGSFRDHYARNHSNPAVCDICGEEFNNALALMGHNRKNLAKPNIAHKKYQTKMKKKEERAELRGKQQKAKKLKPCKDKEKETEPDPPSDFDSSSDEISSGQFNSSSTESISTAKPQ